MSEHQPKIREYDKVKYSDKDMWWANSKTAIAVFVIALIYARFLSVEVTQAEYNTETTEIRAIIEQLEIDLTADIEEGEADLHRRLDTKTARNKAEIDANTEDIKQLQLPNTDE